MHLLRNLIAASTILAFGILAPPAAQAATPSFGPFTVDKICGPATGFTGKSPSYCTITGSSLSALIGAKVMYIGPELGGNGQFVASTVVLLAPAPKTGTALGYCISWRTSPGGPAGMCAFHTGSGTLKGLQAVVKVSVDASAVWHWVGIEAHE